MNTGCILAETSLSLHNGGHVSVCNGSRKMFVDKNDKTITLDTYSLNDAWNSPTRVEIIDALRNNIKHDNCLDCWIKEEAGFPSMRQIHNKNLGHLVPLLDQPRALILKPGNVCNLSCRHCDSSVSSGWYKDDYQINYSDIDYEKYLKKFQTTKNSYATDNPIWKEINDWNKNILYWDLYGAEPLLVTPLIDTLKNAVDKKFSVDQSIHINTNGTVWRNDFIELFPKFKKVNLDISVDGINEQFDYLRYPAKFEYVLDTIHRYKKLSVEHDNIQIMVTVTVSIYNILELPKIFNFFKSRNINCSFNMLHNPEFMNIRALPSDCKIYVKNFLNKNLQHNLKTAIIEFLELEMENKELIKNFIEETDKVDKNRDQKFQETFPEMYELIKICMIQ